MNSCIDMKCTCMYIMHMNLVLSGDGIDKEYSLNGLKKEMCFSHLPSTAV